MRIRITGKSLPKAQIGGECPEGYIKDMNGNCVQELQMPSSGQPNYAWTNPLQKPNVVKPVEANAFPNMLVQKEGTPVDQGSILPIKKYNSKSWMNANKSKISETFDRMNAALGKTSAKVNNAVVKADENFRNFLATNKTVQGISKLGNTANNLLNVASPIVNLIDQNNQNKEIEKTYRDNMFSSMGPVDYIANRGDYEINTGMVDPYNTGAKSKGQFTNPFYLPMAEDGLSLGPISFSDEPVRRNVYQYANDYVEINPRNVRAATDNTYVKRSPVVLDKIELNADFEQYAQKAEKYIKKVNPNTDVTGNMLAAGAQMAYQKTGKIVPVELALAQLQQEGYLAKGSKPNKPQRTKNPFNVGNTDDGSVVNHDTLQSGINTYYDLMSRQYLSARNPEQLLENFVNRAGNRYASDRNYENALKKLIKSMQASLEYGGLVNDKTESMKIRITQEPSKSMKYGGQLGSGLDLGARKVYTDMPDSFSDSVSNTIGPVPREEATIEAEKGETILNDEGHFIIGGKSHAEGGTPLAAEEGDFIFSKKLKMKDPQQMAYFNKSFKKGGYGYADVAKQYNMNKYKSILQDPNADPIAKRTAELMLTNYENKLGMLAMAQEASKGFPQGIPGIAQKVMGEAAYGGYIPEMGYGGYLEEYQTGGPKKVKKSEISTYEKQGYSRVGNTNVWRKENKTIEVKDAIPGKVIPGTQGTPGTGPTVGRAIPGGKPGKQWEDWIKAQLQKGVTIDELVRKGHGTPGGLKPYEPFYKPATQGAPGQSPTKEPDTCPDGYTLNPTTGKCEKTNSSFDEITYDEPTIPKVPPYDPPPGDIPYGWTQQDKNNALLALMNRAGIRKYSSVRRDINPVLSDFRNMDWRGKAAELQGTYNSQMNTMGTYGSPQSLAANASFMAGQQAENLINRAIEPTEQQNVQIYNQVANQNAGVMNAAIANNAQNTYLRSLDRANMNQNYDNAIREADKSVVQTVNQGITNASGIYNTNLTESDTYYYDPRTLKMKFNSPQAQAKYYAAMRNAGPSDGDLASQYMAARRKLEGLPEEEKKAAMEYIFGMKGLGKTSSTNYPFNPRMNKTTTQQPTLPAGYTPYEFNPYMYQGS